MCHNAFKRIIVQKEMDYTNLLERIASAAKVTKEEIEQKIEAKRSKLSGLVSKEGAAQIVAAELGVTFENERLKLNEVMEGMKRVRVVGKITRVFPVREFSKNGRSGKVGSFQLGDTTSNLRVVLWDVNHIELLESKKLDVGSVVEISNAAVRNGELHLSAFSDIKNSDEKMEDVKATRVLTDGFIKDAKAGDQMHVRACVVQVFDPKYFDGKNGEKRALVNIVLDDGTETIRATIGPEVLKELGFTDEDIYSVETFKTKKEILLGDERVFSGSFKVNTYFNKLEMSIQSTKNIDIDSLIKTLQKA